MNGYIKRCGLLTAMLFGCLMLTPSVQAASFDCAKAETKVEKLICGDAELSKLDEELNAAYKAALKDQQQANTVKQAQKLWMKERNSCADADCVKRAYETRLQGLLSHAIVGTLTDASKSAEQIEPPVKSEAEKGGCPEFCVNGIH